MYLCVHVRCICVFVRVCVCECVRAYVCVHVPVRACVHEVKIYHRIGTFNCVLCVCTKSRYTTGVVHSTVILVWQFERQIDKHLVWQIGKGLPKTYLEVYR